MRRTAAVLCFAVAALAVGAARAQSGEDPGARPPLLSEEPAPPEADDPGRLRPLSETERRLAKRGWGFDVMLQGGYGVGVDDDLPRWGLGRLRLGVLHVDQPWIVSFGASGEVGGLTDGWGVGLQADMLHAFSGFVLEAGGAYVRGEAFTVHAAIGWSILALEYQWRDDDALEARHAFFAKLRVPLGLILFFLL